MTALRAQGAGGQNVNKLSNGAPAFRHSRIFTAWRDQTTPNRIPTGASSDAFIVGSAQLEWRGSGSETTRPAENYSAGRVESIDGVATPLHPRAHPSEPCITAPCTDVVEPLLRLGETVLRHETRRYHGLRITHAAQYRIHLAAQLQGGIRGIRWQRAIPVADCSPREPVEPC